MKNTFFLIKRNVKTNTGFSERITRIYPSPLHSRHHLTSIFYDGMGQMVQQKLTSHRATPDSICVLAWPWFVWPEALPNANHFTERTECVLYGTYTGACVCVRTCIHVCLLTVSVIGQQPCWGTSLKGSINQIYHSTSFFLFLFVLKPATYSIAPFLLNGQVTAM